MYNPQNLGERACKIYIFQKKKSAPRMKAREASSNS